MSFDRSYVYAYLYIQITYYNNYYYHHHHHCPKTLNVRYTTLLPERVHLIPMSYILFIKA